VSAKRDEQTGELYFERDGVRYYITPKTYNESEVDKRLRSEFPDVTPFELSFAVAPAPPLNLPFATDASARIRALRLARDKLRHLSDATWEFYVTQVTPGLTADSRTDLVAITAAVERVIAAQLEATEGAHRKEHVRAATAARQVESDRWRARARQLHEVEGLSLQQTANRIEIEREKPTDKRQVSRWLEKKGDSSS
jgi:hypothetical protein